MALLYAADADVGREILGLLQRLIWLGKSLWKGVFQESRITAFEVADFRNLILKSEQPFPKALQASSELVASHRARSQA
jgi:hypothetical protein